MQDSKKSVLSKTSPHPPKIATRKKNIKVLFQNIQERSQILTNLETLQSPNLIRQFHIQNPKFKFLSQRNTAFLSPPKVLQNKNNSHKKMLTSLCKSPVWQRLLPHRKATQHLPKTIIYV